VIFLHGAGERGDDNLSQLKYLPEHLATPESRERYRAFVFAPQCRSESSWVDASWGASESVPMAARPTPDLSHVMTTIEHLCVTEPIDWSRIYLTGLSMGGYGAWELACRSPGMFAAVAPICGGGDESVALRLIRVPIWAWHGELDDAVPVARSRNMVQAVRDAGGEHCRYTELAGEGHKSWIPAYRDESGLLDWLFSQRKAR
jgi:predicted peptidase